MSNREGCYGLYLHLPFCLRKCPYCSFYSIAAGRTLQARYLRALAAQMRRQTKDPAIRGLQATTVFFGGGTPTILPAAHLSALLADSRELFSWTEAAEVSIEVNPATIDGAGLRQLRRAGFNRLSVGVQSLADPELRLLGRPHSAAEARMAVTAARRAGFSNLNLDLMYGLPGQNAEGWRRTLRAALAMGPEHLALYELTIEEATPFADLRAEGRLGLPAEDEVLAMMAVTAEETAQAGLTRYEISNYARPGFECRHNLNYWHNGPYLGFGAGAVAYLAGRRCAAVADVDEYCRLIEAGREPWAGIEELDGEARFRETVVMGLRLTAGVSLADLERRFGLGADAYYGETLRRLRQQGLLSLAGDTLRLSATGLALANRVMAELV